MFERNMEPLLEELRRLMWEGFVWNGKRYALNVHVVCDMKCLILVSTSLLSFLNKV